MISMKLTDIFQLGLPSLLPWLAVFGAAGLAGTAVALVARGLGRSATARTTIGRTAAGALLALPALTGLAFIGHVTVWPAAWSRPDFPVVASWRATTADAAPEQPWDAAPDDSEAKPAASMPARPNAGPARRATGRPAGLEKGAGGTGTPATGPLASRLATAAVLIWLVGVASLLGRVAFGLFSLRRYGREARPVPEDIMRMAREGLRGRRPSGLQVRCGGPFAIPVCWGIVRPTILLPGGSVGWTEERLRIVLRHELAHIDRRDALHILLMRVGTALHWFNPLAWICQRSLERDMEDVCDELVLRGGVPGWRYARALVDTARDVRGARPPLAVPAALGRAAGLERRIERILDGPAAPSGPVAGAAGALVVLLVTAGAVAAAVPPAARPVPQEAPAGAADTVDAPNMAGAAALPGAATLPEAAGPGRIVDALIVALADPAPAVRRSAVNALRDIGEPRGIRAVRNLLDDPDDDVRRVAEEVLGLRPPSRNLVLPTTPPSEPPTEAELDALERALADPDRDTRRDAAWALGNLGDPRSVPALAGHLDDRDPRVREAVASALGNVGDARAVPALTRHLGDEDANVRQAVASALGHAGDARAVPALVAAWPDPRSNVRARIVSALGELQDPAGTDVVLEGLRDVAVHVRRTSAAALGHIGRNVRRDVGAYVSPELAAVCPAIPDTRGLRLADQIDALLSDSDPTVRERAALALGRLAVGVEPADADPGRKTFQHALIAGLSDPAPAVRVAAACSLAEVGDRRALEALAVRTAASEPAELRAAVERAIESIERRTSAAR